MEEKLCNDLTFFELLSICSPVCDWVDSLIGPSGLLLGVSHRILAVPISDL